jgi:hypothetical protein
MPPDSPHEHRTQAVRVQPTLMLALASLLSLLLSILLAACGANSQAPRQFPGSVYVSGDYHFSLMFPNGWKVNEWRDPTPPAGASGAPMPLTVIVTRASATQANSSLVSNLTIAILDLHNPRAVNKDLLKVITTRATNPTYHAVPLAGHTAYATQPVQQPILDSHQIETHTDYYLLANSLEYHLSTDVLGGDQADDAIKGMLASFTLT